MCVTFLKFLTQNNLDHLSYKRVCRFTLQYTFKRIYTNTSIKNKTRKQITNEKDDINQKEAPAIYLLTETIKITKSHYLCIWLMGPQ